MTALSETLYQDALAAFLAEDRSKTRVLVETWSQSGGAQRPRLLIEARLCLFERRFDELESCLARFDQTDEHFEAPFRHKLEGDRLFVEGNYRYLIDASSESHFLKAAAEYARGDLALDQARALMNSTLDLMITNDLPAIQARISQVESLWTDGTPMPLTVSGFILRHRTRLAFLNNAPSKVRALLEEPNAKAALQLLPVRDQVILALYQTHADLDLGACDSARRQMREIRVPSGNPDLEESMKYLEWRLLFQTSGSLPKIDWQPNSLLESFQCRARAFVDRATLGKVTDRCDLQVEHWFAGSGEPPEFRLSLTGPDGERLFWMDGVLLDRDGKVRLRIRRNSLKERLLLRFLKQPELSKWELIEELTAERSSSLDSKTLKRHENHLYVLLHELNQSIPGLIENRGGTYRLTRPLERKCA